MGELDLTLQRILVGAAPVTARDLPGLVRELEAAVAAGDDVTVAAACRALSRYEHIGEVSDETATLWLRGLTGESADIRRAVANLVRRAMQAPQVASFLLTSRPLLDGLVLLVKDDDDAAAADAAIFALAAAAAHAESPSSAGQLVSALMPLVPRSNVAKAESVAAARLASLVALLAGASDATCHAVDASGLLAATLGMVTGSDDVLLQLAVLDVISPLARSAAGYTALTKSGILLAVHSWAGIGVDSDVAVEPLLEDAALAASVDMFAALARRDRAAAAAAAERTSIIRRVFGAVVAADVDGYGDEASAVRSIASLTALVTADADALHEALASPRVASAWLGAGRASAPAELQAAAFESVARLLEAAAARGALPPPSNGNSDSQSGASVPPLALQVVDAFGRESLGSGGDAVSAALTALRRPVPAPRAAAYHFLVALAAVPSESALRRLLGNAGAAELLLGGAQSEPTAEGREWRYDVIVAASRNPLLRAAVGDGIANALVRLRQVGPHAAAAATHAVATMH